MNFPYIFAVEMDSQPFEAVYLHFFIDVIKNFLCLYVIFPSLSLSLFSSDGQHIAVPKKKNMHELKPGKPHSFMIPAVALGASALAVFPDFGATSHEVPGEQWKCFWACTAKMFVGVTDPDDQKLLFPSLKPTKRL